MRTLVRLGTKTRLLRGGVPHQKESLLRREKKQAQKMNLQRRYKVIQAPLKNSSGPLHLRNCQYMREWECHCSSRSASLASPLSFLLLFECFLFLFQICLQVATGDFETILPFRSAGGPRLRGCTLTKESTASCCVLIEAFRRRLANP